MWRMLYTVQANIVEVVRERTIHVVGGLNNRGLESYEIEEGLSKMKYGKPQC